MKQRQLAYMKVSTELLRGFLRLPNDVEIVDARFDQWSSGPTVQIMMRSDTHFKGLIEGECVPVTVAMYEGDRRGPKFVRFTECKCPACTKACGEPEPR